MHLAANRAGAYHTGFYSLNSIVGFFSGHPKNTTDNLNYIYLRQPLHNAMKTVAKEIEIVFGYGIDLDPKNAINSK